MKVLHVLSHFLPRQIAGTEVYVWSLIKHLPVKEITSMVAIPNYGSNETQQYLFDGIQVILFGENSVVDRELIMGRRQASGVANFNTLLDEIKPDIVHFHELSGSNGITIDHIRVAKRKTIKIIMTFHLSIYSCKTGKLMYKGKEHCDGKMIEKRCSSCYLQDKGYSRFAPVLIPFSRLLHAAGIRANNWNHKLGTALGTVSLVDAMHGKFWEIISLCDRVVALSDWYKEVLIRNGVQASKIHLISQGLPHSSDKQIKGKRNNTLPIRLIYVGRISVHKGLDLLIRAIKCFPADQVQLDIFGQEAGDAYANYCHELSKDVHNIRWMGVLEPTDVVKVMSAYDLLCLCSATCEMAP